MESIFEKYLLFFYVNFNALNLKYEDYKKLISGWLYHAIVNVTILEERKLINYDFSDTVITIPSDIYLKKESNYLRDLLIQNNLIQNSSYNINCTTSLLKKILFYLSKKKEKYFHETSMLNPKFIILMNLGYCPNLTWLYFNPSNSGSIKTARLKFKKNDKVLNYLIDLYPTCFFENSSDLKKIANRFKFTTKTILGIGYFFDPVFMLSSIYTSRQLYGTSHGGTYGIYKNDFLTNMEKNISSKYFNWFGDNTYSIPLRFIRLGKAKSLKNNKILWIGSSEIASTGINSNRFNLLSYNNIIDKIHNYLVNRNIEFDYKAHPIGMPQNLFKKNLNLVKSNSKNYLNEYNLIIFDHIESTLQWNCMLNDIRFVSFYSNESYKLFSDEFKKFVNKHSSIFINIDKIDYHNILDETTDFKTSLEIYNIKSNKISSIKKRINEIYI